MITNRKPRRVKITKIHPRDAFYDQSDELVGLTGEFTPFSGGSKPGYFAGELRFDDKRKGLQTLLFHAIRYIRI